MLRDKTLHDRDTGCKVERPEGYTDPLYYKVTNLHNEYLKALGDIEVGKFVTDNEWLEKCEARGVKTNEGKTPQ